MPKQTKAQRKKVADIHMLFARFIARALLGRLTNVQSLSQMEFRFTSRMRMMTVEASCQPQGPQPPQSASETNNWTLCPLPT